MTAVNPCTFGGNVQGRQNSAEWIRTAFHDMATHDAKAGTGGLDASIFFELERGENIGSAFNNTFAFFYGYHSVRASASDLIALGVVKASNACGGPKVQFRGGRVDASNAGPAGVPEPSTDLDTTTATFKKAGFSKQDMIAMVAVDTRWVVSTAPTSLKLSRYRPTPTTTRTCPSRRTSPRFTTVL